MKTRYFGPTGHNDGQPDDDAGLSAGEEHVSREVRADTCVRARARI